MLIPNIAAMVSKAMEVAQQAQNDVNAFPAIRHGIVDVPQMEAWQESIIDVNFVAPMPNSNYSVSLTLADGGSYWASIRYKVRNGSVSTTGFQVNARMDAEGTNGAAKLHWITVG